MHNIKKSIRKNIECLEFNYDNLSLVYSILRKMNFKKKIILNVIYSYLFVVLRLIIYRLQIISNADIMFIEKYYFF